MVYCNISTKQYQAKLSKKKKILEIQIHKTTLNK